MLGAGVGQDRNMDDDRKFSENRDLTRMGNICLFLSRCTAQYFQFICYLNSCATILVSNSVCEILSL